MSITLPMSVASCSLTLFGPVHVSLIKKVGNDFRSTSGGASLKIGSLLTPE